MRKSCRNRKRNTVRGLALISALLVFLSGCFASKQPTETKAAESSSSKEISTTFIEKTETATQTTLVPATTAVSEEETEVRASAKTYDKLLSELMAALSEKGFGSDVNDTLIETFNRLYDNYNNWQGLYKDLPTREEFIRDKLINSIKYIKEFNIYEEDSPEEKELIRKYNAIYFTTNDNVIFMVNGNSDISMIALHEIAHTEQNIEESPSIQKQNYFYNGVILSEALCEGEATFYMKFTESPSSKKTSSDYIENSKGFEVNYRKSIREGYAKYLNLYENLVLFAGYENLNSVKGEKIPAQIEKAIAQNYGNELATEVMESFAELIKSENSYNKNKQYEQAIKTQTVFLKCIEHDIDSLSNKNDVKKYVNIYRGYKLNNLLQVTDSQGNNITNETFDIERLDDKLISKIIKYNAISEFTKDENLNKMALRVILLASHELYYENNGIYLPCNLDNTEYTYFEADGIGYVEFDPKDGRRLQIAFDDEEIMYIQEP